VKILANPEKEAANRVAHGLGFELVEDLFRLPVLVLSDDRPLGFEHEGRLRALGQVYGRVFFLSYQPEDLTDGTAACRPISFRYATRTESHVYWSVFG
jgi:uncharacterized DUF497 family protein